MRIVHYGSEKGGGIVIISALDSHVEEYTRFLLEELLLDMKRIPKRADKISGFRIKKNNSVWILPPARGTSKTLVPAPGAYPCSICEFAQYNQLCQYQRTCAPFAYWTLRAADKLNNNGSPDLKKAFLTQFGKKIK